MIKTEQEKIIEKERHLLEKSEISLWLDSYEDIFSDFDPRPYSERALSQDFLGEANRASRDKNSGKLQLNILIPAGKRQKKHEELIKRRLHDHFRKHKEQLAEEKSKICRKGGMFTAFGVVTMFFATILLFKYQEESIFTSFMVVVLEPAGWFLFWEGLNLLLFESKREKTDLEFYQKMSKAEIKFLSC